MEADRHAVVIARDPRNSKDLFAQSSRTVDFSHHRRNVLVRQWIFQAGRCRPAAVRPVLVRSWLVEDPMASEDVEDTPDLSISPEKVCYIIVKAREFDAKDVVTDPDDGSNPTDDAMIAVLEDHRDDPVVQEIAAAIFAMTEDEQVDLVTLAWLGRGDGSLEDWNELRAEALRAHNKRTASYLLGIPLLADYLEEALAQFGHSCDE
jgi:Protein of unknown function (DUF3775)